MATNLTELDGKTQMYTAKDIDEAQTGEAEGDTDHYCAYLQEMLMENSDGNKRTTYIDSHPHKKIKNIDKGKCIGNVNNNWLFILGLRSSFFLYNLKDKWLKQL